MAGPVAVTHRTDVDPRLPRPTGVHRVGQAGGALRRVLPSPWITYPASIILGAGVWELVGRLGPKSKLVFVPLSTVLESLGDWFSHDHGLADLRTSAIEF